MSLENRLDDLEIRFMHTETSVEELTRALLQLQTRMHEQAETIQRLERQLRELSKSQVAGRADEPPPPHY